MQTVYASLHGLCSRLSGSPLRSPRVLSIRSPYVNFEGSFAFVYPFGFFRTVAYMAGHTFGHKHSCLHFSLKQKEKAACVKLSRRQSVGPSLRSLQRLMPRAEKRRPAFFFLFQQIRVRVLLVLLSDVGPAARGFRVQSPLPPAEDVCGSCGRCSERSSCRDACVCL